MLQPGGFFTVHAFICFLDFITNLNIEYQKIIAATLLECQMNQRIIKYLSLATCLRTYLDD